MNKHTTELAQVSSAEVQQWFLDAGFKLVRQSSTNLYKWVSFANGAVYMRVCFGVRTVKIEVRSQSRDACGHFTWNYWAAGTYAAAKKSGSRLLVGAAWLDFKTFK